jgi:3-oxoadipate enol-lactonase
MLYVSFDQLALYYETHGDPGGTPVMLIHGIGADHEMWKPQIASLPAAGTFIIVPDLRGHGYSDRPETFRIADCARDLCDMLDHLDLQRVHLVGVSMGGMVVQQFVVDYPERATSQVLVDTLSGVTRPVERFNAWMAATLLKVLPPKYQAALIRRSYRNLGHEEVGEYFEDRLLSMSQPWLLLARLEVNRFSVISALPDMDLPTLVLVGDAFGDLAIDMAHTTATGIRGAQFQVLPGGGDPSNLLVPAAFDEALLAFFKAQAAPYYRASGAPIPIRPR